jgi:FPC/CPF motif-containing protein YcgG
MTLNPPDAVAILRDFHQLASGSSTNDLAPLLARLLRIYRGKQDYRAFLAFWHLHLQNLIPLDLAREAWGLTQTPS